MKGMRTILVIEDDADVLDNTLDLLQSEGFFAIGAADGFEGIQAARDRRPDLIICDIMMPQVDGYEVLRRLREQTETTTIPFIYVTARASKTDLRAGMNLGADDYLVKPFTAEELLEAVHSRLDRHDEQSRWFRDRLDALKSNLSRTLPHELRTPLSCILGYSQFLAEISDTVTREELRSMLGQINEAGKRLERLVENYHLYAQLEMATSDPAHRAAMLTQGLVLPVPIIGAMAGLVAKKAGRPLDLYLDVHEGAVRMQDAYLKKVVEEIVDNAFKFSAAGSPVYVMAREEGASYVMVVSDYGRGMAAEQLAEMSAFVQFDRGKHEQQGLGLGLAITRKLVELHQGSLMVESSLGVSTTVQVSLPSAR